MWYKFTSDNKPLVKITGTAPMATPYAVNTIQPNMLYQRSFTTSVIVNDATNKADAICTISVIHTIN